MKEDDRIYSGATPEQVAEALRPLVDFVDEGIPLDELANRLEQRLVPHLMRYDSPCFQSMFNAFPEPGAKLGARLALDWNQGVTNWQVSPGGSVLEELCMEALCRLFEFEPGAGGTVMYCGTYANQQAVYTALHKRAEQRGFNLARRGIGGFGDPARLAVVTSVDAHFSLNHTVRMLGLGEQSLIPVAVDDNRRIDLAQLERTLQAARDTREVFCVVATAGTTATGAIDPLPRIAELCAEFGCWLHVDGAYGLAYKLVPRWEQRFAGLERADSVSWDPHKQFAVPIPSSVLFYRKKGDFGRMAYHSSYFNQEDSGVPNPGTRSAPTTRPLTALPLVTSILHRGLNGIRRRLAAPLTAMQRLADLLDGEPDMALVHRPDTGIVCFRVTPSGTPEAELDGLQQRIYEGLLGEGRRSISITRIDDRLVLRVVAISPGVTFNALEETIREIRTLARQR